jgi:hypothetical protein
MNMFWFAQVLPLPPRYNGGFFSVDDEIDMATHYSIKTYLLVAFAFLMMYFAFAVLIYLKEKERRRCNFWPEHPVPRYPVIPKPRQKRKARPPSEPANGPHLISEQPQAIVPPQDIPHVEAALESNGDERGRLSHDTKEEKENAEPAKKN